MDFSHIVVNEVEIETSNVSSISENQKNKTKSIASRERPFFELSDYSNGALLDELNYCWSQSFTDIGNFLKHFRRKVIISVGVSFMLSRYSCPAA